MNKRIKELAEQAGVYEGVFTKHGGVSCNLKGYSMLPDEMAKFAELIVAECVTKLKETKKVELPFIQAVNEHAQELPLSVYIAELKQHFRVEE